jgi:ELWxxDGT repeat protein
VPIELINLNGTLLYQGTDGGTSPNHGVELWRSDGTVAGTVMVKDINPGAGDSYPGRMTKVGDYVVFLATQTGLAPVNSELWRTDGTTAGTAIIEDINPSAGGLDTSPPPTFALLGSTLLFGADDGTTGVELWKGVDTIAPNSTIDSGPAEGSTVAAGAETFGFSSDDPPSTFECRVYATGGTPPAFAPCSGAGTHTTAALTAGPQTFEVRATDASGNTDPTPATRSFTVAVASEPPPATNPDKTPP